VNTISGQEDISLQLLEQSPLAMDGVIFDDLSRDYDQRLDLQVILGSGANGQHLGVLNVAGATSNTNILKASQITVSSASFVASGGQYNSIVNGVNQIETLRFNSDNLAVWVHPRRSNSWAFAVDGNGRPLFVKGSYQPWNALGVNEPNPLFQGVAGEVFGLPVVKDANMPTTMNGTATTGGTADPIVVLKEDDLVLFEGAVRMRALPEILSGTLQIRFQLYAYSAFIPNRFPPSISQLTGNTGLAAPTF
jgi:HK97 family phage major capsid protein